jgi:uncharacterized protein (TIGR03083 family)
MSDEHAAAYRAVHRRVRDLVATADPAALDAIAPATPEWRVRDLLAHFVGVTDDVVNGRLEGIATDAWTAKQVDARRDTSVDDMLAEWDAQFPRFEEMLAGAPGEIAGQAIFDAMTHEHDIRHALGRPGARDSDAVDIAWGWIIEARAANTGKSLRFVTDTDDVAYGSGPAIATVRASRFELLRAISGRRSAREIEVYEWEPKPEPIVLLGAAIFTLRPNPLNE